LKNAEQETRPRVAEQQVQDVTKASVAEQAPVDKKVVEGCGIRCSSNIPRVL
jgi:hypothetical protein